MSRILVACCLLVITASKSQNALVNEALHLYTTNVTHCDSLPHKTERSEHRDHDLLDCIDMSNFAAVAVTTAVSRQCMLHVLLYNCHHDHKHDSKHGCITTGETL